MKRYWIVTYIIWYTEYEKVPNCYLHYLVHRIWKSTELLPTLFGTQNIPTQESRLQGHPPHLQTDFMQAGLNCQWTSNHAFSKSPTCQFEVSPHELLEQSHTVEWHPDSSFLSINKNTSGSFFCFLKNFLRKNK